MMLGRPLVLLSIALAAYAGVAAPAAMRRRAGAWIVARPDLLASARRAIVGTAAALTVASLSLWYALFSRDFSIEYVAQHVSHVQQPWYVFSAFWAGMDGSMLLWCWILALSAAAFVAPKRGTGAAVEPFVPFAIPILSAALVFFGALTAGPTNPFRALDVVPLDGRGLNPLLQSPGMIIHPPLLYVGYTGLIVPLAVAVSALLLRRTGADWLRAVRRWTLIPWLALGAGMVLGSAWAYTELGWGGYWGWDPVENAALLPWLAATAFLHSSVVQERRGMLRIWNVLLVLIAADLAVFGTFLTRSGLLSSVHTFTESPLGRWYFGYLAAQTLLGLAVLAWRLPDLRTQGELDSPLSKESGFLANNLVLLGATIAIFWGTLLPTITEAFVGQRITVGPPFFNRLMAPVGVLLLALAAVGPVMPWRRGSALTVLRRLRIPGVVAAAFGLAALAGSARAAFAGVVFMASLVAAVSVNELVAAARARGRATGTGALRTAVRLVGGNPRRYGGYFVHLGVAVMVVGFAGSLFGSQTDVVVAPGERFRAGSYTLELRELVRWSAPDKEIRMAVLDVSQSGTKVATLRPQQNVHLNFDQPQSEIAIRTTVREDLYVILTGTSSDSEESAFRVYVNPLVFWVWAGGALAVMGGLVALVAGRRRGVAGPTPRDADRADRYSDPALHVPREAHRSTS